MSHFIIYKTHTHTSIKALKDNITFFLSWAARQGRNSTRFDISKSYKNLSYMASFPVSFLSQTPSTHFFSSVLSHIGLLLSSFVLLTIHFPLSLLWTEWLHLHTIYMLESSTQCNGIERPLGVLEP